jgi:hypothetical protein
VDLAIDKHDANILLELEHGLATAYFSVYYLFTSIATPIFKLVKCWYLLSLRYSSAFLSSSLLRRSIKYAMRFSAPLYMYDNKKVHVPYIVQYVVFVTSNNKTTLITSLNNMFFAFKESLNALLDCLEHWSDVDYSAVLHQVLAAV